MDDPRLFDLPVAQEVDRGVPRQPYPLWSEHKASLVEEYLRLFLLVTHHGTYIDAFAGPQEPAAPETWTARRVLELRSDAGELRHFYLIDRNELQVRRLIELRAQHPARDVQVIGEDVNQAIPQLLGSGVIAEKEAVFCLIDQRTAECHWATIQQLARHKGPYKIEIFYFLAQWWLDRAMGGALAGNEVFRLWWGSDGWRKLLGMKGWERAALMRNRFIDELGYHTARPWPIYSRSHGGRIAYFMIHASDHHRADALMTEAYRKVLGRLPPVDQPSLF